MKSLRNLYKVGKGPSSSHTMGPEKACKFMKEAFPNATSFKVVLYGSLALTGKGHGTDKVIVETLAPAKVNLIMDFKTLDLPHPNTMDVIAYLDDIKLGEHRILSVGGGSIEILGMSKEEEKDIYPHTTFAEIEKYCKDKGIRLYEYVEEVEGKEIWNYLSYIWGVMKTAISLGLKKEGILDGGLEVKRKAKLLLDQSVENEHGRVHENRLIAAYAFAVSEQNASCGEVVTAPTCGACGVVPSILKYIQEHDYHSDEEILKALATGGLIGNLIKENASISGAEAGCQAEVGSACSMAAAALAELKGLSIDQIEYSAEVALEHHLGLTCDPIAGLVQIPCIERNAVAAMRALNAMYLATFLTDTNKIAFDTVVKTMLETGKDLNKSYRETSEGGLAKTYYSGN